MIKDTKSYWLCIYLKNVTAKDKTLTTVLRFTKLGYTDDFDADDNGLKPFYQIKDELSCEDGVLLRGVWVVIPKAVQDVTLSILHSNHLGITKMNSLAQSFIWWQNIDKGLKKCVPECSQCQDVQKSPPKATLNPWKWPGKPWYRLCWSSHGQAYPGQCRIEARILLSTLTSYSVIDSLRRIFATFELPSVIVSDNGR